MKEQSEILERQRRERRHPVPKLTGGEDNQEILRLEHVN
jgi:hypothetical protein